MAGIHWFKYSAPANFYPLAGRMIPWFAGAAAVLTVVGLYIGFFVAPTDYQQGEAYRIIYIHVPAAWMAMFAYLVMAGWCAVSLIWKFLPNFTPCPASRSISATSATGSTTTPLPITHVLPRLRIPEGTR